MIKPTTYFPVLDGMRGIAALLVVLRHCNPFIRNPFEKSYLAVDMFFLLSGVVLLFSYEARLKQDLPARSFIAIRIIRLYPLYVFGTILGIAAAAIADIPDFASIPSAALMVPRFNLHHLDLYPFDGPAWSLFLEVVASFAYGLLGFRLTTSSLVRLACTMLALLCLFLAAMPEHTLDLGWSNHTFIGGLARLAFSFSLGIVSGRIVQGQARNIIVDGRSATLGTWILLSIVSMILTFQPPTRLSWLYDLAAVAVVFPLLVRAAMCMQPSAATVTACRWLGIVSFPIYILHVPFVRLLKIEVTRLGWTPCELPLPIAVLLLAALILFAAMVDSLYDKPVRRWLTTRFTARTLGPPSKGPNERSAAPTLLIR